MKSPFKVDSLMAKDAISIQSPINVCMHVLGGARTDGRVMRAATALVEAGFDVSIVDVEGDLALPVEEEIQGVSIKHIIIPDWFIPTRFKPWFLVKLVLLLIVGTIQLLRTPADMYHAHEEMALPACYIAARLRRKPLIYEAHELPLAGPIFIRWPRLSRLSACLLTVMASGCAGTITVSPPIAQEIRRCYHGPEVTVIRSIPAYRAVQRSDRLRQHLGLSPETRIALYQGYIDPARQLDNVVRAATFLEQNIVIVLMGKGVGETASELEALIASEGVAERVKIIPPVPYAELLNWTASADIGLTVFSPDYSLSVRWCLPNKLFEYLMAGLPVLTSQLDAVTEVISTYEVGQVVSSLAPEDIAAAINAMLADRVALARMHRNALEAAKHDLCWEQESQRLIHLYHTVLNKVG